MWVKWWYYDDYGLVPIWHSLTEAFTDAFYQIIDTNVYANIVKNWVSIFEIFLLKKVRKI